MFTLPVYVPENKFSGQVMRGNAVVAMVENDVLVSCKRTAPIYLQRTQDFTEWLRDRAADVTRSNVRAILGHLRLPQMNPTEAAKSVYAVSLTDNFWIRPNAMPQLRYSNVVFSRKNIYFYAALRGISPEGLDKIPSPELTNIGSFNKGWRFEKGGWFLYKTGTPYEIFSELFVSVLARQMGFDAVEYTLKEGFIRCKNFVKNKESLESAKSLTGASVDYIANARIMAHVGVLNPYLDMLYTDALVRNGDRHEFNYGVITTAKGDIRFAPNFDNNLALFHAGIPPSSERNDPLVRDFIEVALQFDYNPRPLTPQIITQAYETTKNEMSAANMPLCPDITAQACIDFCLNAYKNIKKGLIQHD
jgi:hypothetical protein